MKEPTITETAFSCPHCGAYTTQYWHSVYVRFLRGESKKPVLPPADFAERLTKLKDVEREKKRTMAAWAEKMHSKLLFTDGDHDYNDLPILHNLFLSECYNCKRWAIWVNEDLVYPSKKYGSIPNQDLPPAILAVVDEGRSILDLSPKGAAAMLRLAIQMLCKHLGESGENLNDDISSLVVKGLSPVVQKSLDVVRVIGNESVHPGQIDLNDDRDTAMRLFDLVNIIAEQLITQPKHVTELYEKLPEGKRKAIEKRDSKE